MKRIDRKDITLINILQKDARTKLNSLSESLGLTKSPVHDRILMLLRDGFIRNFRAVVDRQKFGYRYRAFVRIEPVVENFEAAIAAFHEVEIVYLLTDQTFMLLVNTHDVKSYSQFITRR